MKTLLIAAAFALVASSAAQAQELWIVATDEHNVMVVDADSRVSLGGDVWRMTSHLISNNFDAPVDGARPTYATTTWEFDCAGHRRRELSLTFAARDWRVLGSSDEPQRWDPVIADSNGESELNFACGRRDDPEFTRATDDNIRRLGPALLDQLERGGSSTPSSKT